MRGILLLIYSCVALAAQVPKGELFRKQVHRGDLKALKTIGAGQYGEVYLAIQTAQKPGPMGGGTIKIKRAVKMLKNNARREDKTEFLREAGTMLTLGDHENLVKMVGVAVQQAPWLAVLEFCQYGDLRDVVKTALGKGIKLEVGEQVSFSYQLACGCAHMAKHRLVHMDLAARNTLLSNDNRVKVSDSQISIAPLSKWCNNKIRI